MRKLFSLLLMFVALVSQGPAAVSAQTVDAKVCDIVNHPSRFDGQLVRLTGTVQVGFDSFIMRGDSCSTALWLSYPAGTRAKAGPAANVTLQLAANAAATPGKVRPPVTLERSKDFDAFDTLLSQKVKLPGMCLGCVKNNVQATLVGRIDGVDDPGLKRDSAGKITALDGFGNLSLYPARLVIQSISNVSAVEIDFGQIPKIKGDNAGTNDKDFMGLTRKSEAAFPKGTDPVAQIERALNAYGAQGVDNGVTISFDGANEVPAGEGMKSAKSSADGLLLTAHFDPDRLKGDTLSRAIAHEGEEMADVRESSVSSLQQVEGKAWQTVLLVTIGSRQKSLTLPGALLLYNDDWPQAERSEDVSQALNSYLNNHEQLPR